MTLEGGQGAVLEADGKPRRRGIRLEDLPGPGRKGSALYRLLRVLVGGSRDHAFLDRWWIGPLLACTPPRLRAPLALRLLSFSPHYWIYQWTGLYPYSWTRGEVLRGEYERNIASRRLLCDLLLRRYLSPGQTALDFGCGPGFLARAVSPHVRRVIATDVSRGVIACARRLNAAPNITYVANRLANLKILGNDSVDLVYSFAVFQHLLKEQSQAFFAEFARVLRPGGLGVCHLPLARQPGPPKDGTGHSWMYRLVTLRTLTFTADEVTAMLHAAGFRQVEVVPISSLADIDDDIYHEHLLLFRR
jgi:ubiquinone/menaquinone biosynthesis C-methylase UbiE